jgi:hypothetical protein
MSIIIEKGAIRSQIRGIETLPIIISLYEVIDDRKHSKSNKVFIDFDFHNKICMVGFEEEASKDDIDNMVKWFNTNKEQINVDNIASKGIGLKYFEFRGKGEWKHISKSSKKNVYYTSEINTNDIWNAENDDTISSIHFSEILHRGTSFVKEEEELPLTIENIFKNEDNKYPFQPKTIFRCKNLNNIDMLDEYKDEKGVFDFDDLIKRLKIKYYKEIYEGLELYIKLPGYSDFKIIENDNIDVIGFSNYLNNDLNNNLKIDIFINSQYHYGYFFKIGENTYKFGKNGNSIRREKINISNAGLPDFSLFQYNINDMSKKDKNNSIVGKSEEAYAGLFIEIGGTFISDQPVEWSVTKRNLGGAKQYRAILQCLSPGSKHHLKLSGLKAQFNLATMNNLHNCIKSLTDVHKKYCKNNSLDSDEYVLIKTTASKSDIDKQIDGYFYIVDLGSKFFKFGYSEYQQRVFDYTKEETVTKYKSDFPDIEFHKYPYCRFLSISKIKNITLLEEKIKTLINESAFCQTYDNQNGNDIREFFICYNYDTLHNLIIDEINNH